MSEYVIKVKKKDIYGAIRFYPENELAEVICDLLERKTFNQDHLDIFMEYDWKIIYVPDSL